MKRLIPIFSLSLLLAGNGFAQIDRSMRPKPSVAPDINIKDSEVFKTENGITVILSENHKLPRISMRLVMGSDPRLEKDKAGISELVGEMIMGGTKNRSKDQLDKEIDYVGATLGATSKAIYMSCLTKHLDKVMDLYTDVLKNPIFPQSEFDRIVKQQESGLLSTKASPDAMSSNVVSRVNFPNHPYGEVMTEQTLANITQDDIIAYYTKNFTPDGSYLVIVGDIDKAAAARLVQKYFADWKGVEKYSYNWPAGFLNKGNRVIFVKKPGAVQSKITVTFPMRITPGDPDQIAVKVLNGILGGGGFGTRLMQNLREDKAYTYGCYSSVNVTDNGSWFSASGNFRNEVSDSAITQILYELDRITTSHVTDDELNLTKSSMAGSFARSLERPSTVADFALNIIRNELPKDYYQTYLKKLAAVDKDAILTMAQKYLTAKNCNIVVVGNEDIIEKLKVFDSDGEIEFLDAFGQEIIDMKEADITADQLLEKYVLAITKSSSMKAAKKKVKKIKSTSQEMELKSPMFPGAMSMNTYFMAPNKEAMKMEMQGMVIQKSYFDGEKGAATNMQTGKKEMTEEEIMARKKSVGVIPEMNYATSGMGYELKGIETIKDKEYYVLELNDGTSTKTEYYDKETFMKYKSISAQQGQETTSTYGDFKEVNGMVFPHSMTLSIGQMTLNGTVKEIKVNGKIDSKIFKD
ncbi:MAG: insulinase family protein [Bacteroidetes bacterium]|nr:MAG: insulinase family protein [Bacteroidota bacterium]